MQLYLKICKDYEDFIQENIARQYSGDQRKEAGHVGIKNQGATCYLNSLLQSLFMTPELRRLLYKWRKAPGQDEAAETTNIPLQLQLLLRLRKTKRSLKQKSKTAL